jgi:hypothetical protein
MSRKTSFEAGAIHFQKPPALTPEAQQLLKSEGYDAFTKRYGDFYVTGLQIGGDAAVLVSQALSKSQSSESLQVQVEVQFLCFSDSEELVNETSSSATTSAQLSLTAFDSLDQSFMEFSAQKETSLRFEDARRLTQEYAMRVEKMPSRVAERIEALGSNLTDKSILGWGQVVAISQTDVVSRLVLVPFSSHRDVKMFM